MFSAAFRMLLISYRLFWMALITITAGACALAFHFVSLRLVRWLWRLSRRPNQRSLSEARGNRQVVDFGKRVSTGPMAPHITARDKVQ